MSAKRKAAMLAGAVMLATASCGSDGRNAEDVSSPPPGSPAGTERFYQQKISWADCEGGFECADVKVPLDYAKPAAGDLEIAVVRKRASRQSARIGSLLVNPGGPGGSGNQFLRNAGHLFGTDLQERFDLVGFDPRGVSDSDPVRCLDGKQLDRFFGTDNSPDDQTEVTAISTVSEGFAKGCAAKSGNELPHVGTPNAARDMDVLRAALGDRRLTFFGASYGTYLGAMYAELFPKNVRALVLDGAIDPKLSAMELNIEQAKGFETALRSFARQCVAAAGCPLGNKSVNAAVQRITGLLKQVDRKPLTSSLGDGREVTESWAVLGIATALYSKEYWTVLQTALDQAIKKNDGTMLLRLADSMIERRPGGDYTNQMEANLAVNCLDKPYPATAEAFAKEAASAAKVAPRFGPFVVWGSLPCAFWPAKTTEPPKALTADGAKPILVIGTTRDPATPYEWAQKLASQLASGVLLTFDGDGHTAYLQGNRCVSEAANRYLVEGKPPKDGTSCK